MSDTMRGRGWRAAAWRMVAFAAAMVAGAAAKADTLVPWADSTWKYVVVAPGEQQGFESPSFDDSEWTAGRAPFGTQTCSGGTAPATGWPANTSLLARMRLNLSCPTDEIFVRVVVDDRIQVWVNGLDVTNSQGSGHACGNSFVFQVPREALIAGDNTIAVRATDFGGLTYFDASVTTSLSIVSVTPAYVSVPTFNPSSVEFHASLYSGFPCPEAVAWRWQRRNPTVDSEVASDSWLNVEDGATYSGSATATLTILTPNEDLAVPHRCVMETTCLCSSGAASKHASAAVSFGMVWNVAAWGADWNGQRAIPGGVTFDQIVCSGSTSVGLRADGTLIAWGASASSAPTGRFVSLAGGWHGFVAIRDNGTAVGWGDAYHCATCPPAGTFRKVAPAFAGGMGIRTDGTLVSWGSSGIYTSNVPQGRFVDLAVNDVCYAIREDGIAVRFGARTGDGPAVEIYPDTRFVSVHVGNGFAVLLAADGTLRGDGGGLGSSVPSGTFRSVAAGYDFAVAVRTDGSLVHWGASLGPLPLPPPGGFRRVSAGTFSSTAFAFTSDACADLGNIAITQQPQNTTVLPIAIATFSVEAAGPMQLTYQWRRNGLSLAGSSRVSGVDGPVLFISGMRREDQGRYDCVLTDACRRVVTSGAELSCRPVFQREPSNAMIAGGQSVPIDVEVTGFPTSLQWRKDGVPLRDSASYSGVNTATLWITGNDPNQSGSYDLVAVNACGSTASTKATIIVTDGSGPACPGDFNGDGGVDGLDLFLFFENWEQGC